MLQCTVPLGPIETEKEEFDSLSKSRCNVRSRWDRLRLRVSARLLDVVLEQLVAMYGPVGTD